MIGQWVAANWDKLLGLAGAAVGGYLSGIYVVSSELADVRERLASLEAQMQHEVRPKVEQADKDHIVLESLRNEMGTMRIAEEQAKQTNRTLDLLIESKRLSTTSELRELMSSSQRN